MIDIEAVRTSHAKNRNVALKPTFNEEMGRMSSSLSAFNERNWGSKARIYARAAQKLEYSRFVEVMNKAKELTVANGKRALSCMPDSDSQPIDEDQIDKLCTGLVDNMTDDDDDNNDNDNNDNNDANCKFYSLFVVLP